MQTPRKRKRETAEVRITYDAPSRTFDRLFKEQSLEEIKDVVRRKLGVATSVPIYLSQVRDGKSVDLEDEDDFDAFRNFALTTQVAQVKVVVGSDVPITQLHPKGDSEFSPSSVKKKKKKSDATLPSSVASSSALVDLPPQKKRRVSFVEPSREVPATPEKKKRKHIADSPAPPESRNEAPSDISLLATKSATNESTEKKKKKKKKTPATVSEELTLTHSETIPESPPLKKTKKRTREEDTSQVLPPPKPQQTDSLADEEDDPPRPAKKSKKKRKPDDEPIPQNSGSRSVSPTSMRKTSTLDLSPPAPSVEPEESAKSKKSKNKGKERGVSGSPSTTTPSSPEQVQHDEASNEKKKKGESKLKADDSLSVDPSTTTRAKATEAKKNKVNLAQHKETPTSDSAIPNQTTKKKEKAAESPQATKDTTSRKDKNLDEPSSAPVETKTASRRRKTQDAETSKTSKSGTSQEKSRDPEISREEAKAATLAAVQAVLERNSIPTSQAPQVTTPQPGPQAVTSEGEEELPAQEEEPCALCDGLPTHDRPLCPVIKGGMRAMRKRLAQLEKDTSGDEAKQEKRQKVIAELQVMIQKRSRKPKTANAAINGAAAVEKAAVRQNEDPLPATPAPIAKAAKTSKQVDVVSPPTPVVDIVSPLASSQPVESTPFIAKSPSLEPPPASQLPSSSQKSVAKTAQNKVTAENLMANLPLVSEPSLVSLRDLPLSQVTDDDLQSIIHGSRLSIADMPSSDEDEDDNENEDQEEPFFDEDEPQQKISRRLSQGSTRVEYPSSSDAEEEEDNSTAGSVSEAKTSLSTEGGGQTDDGQISEDPGEGDTSFREVDSRGSSREIVKTGDNAFEAGLTKGFVTLNAAPRVNGKRKGAEADSDTAVGSQVEEIVDLRAKEKKVEFTTATTDPIEPSKEPSSEQPELIVSDGDHPSAQSTPKVGSIMRTRSQKKKDTEQQDESIVQPKTMKKVRKITELPVPSPPSPRVTKSSSSSTTTARRTKAAVQQDHEENGSDGGDDVDDRPPKLSINGKVGSKLPIKVMKRSANTRSKATTGETSKGKASTKGSSRVSAANGAVATPKPLHKITPTEPIGLVEEINRAYGGGKNIIGSQWAVLQESNPLTETPGQVDELLSDFADQTPHNQNREPLFLPSATQTQQSFPYSQFPEIFATPRGNDAHEPSHESEDENEVIASVVKTAQPVRTYRGLSQIASSQTFSAPKFQPADFGKMKEPESLYGRNRHDVVSETDSSSESDRGDRSIVSHIPASRRAGLPPLLKK